MTDSPQRPGIPLRTSALRAARGRQLVGITFAAGVLLTATRLVTTAPEVPAMLLSLAAGISVSIAIAAGVAIAVAISLARRRALERQWFQSAFSGDVERVLGTLDRRYLVDLVGLASPAKRSADLAFGTVVYRYPYLPESVVLEVLARAETWIGSTMETATDPVTVAASPERGMLARLATGSTDTDRHRFGSAARFAAIVLLVTGIITFFPLASIAESAWLQAVGVGLVAASAGLFVAYRRWTDEWMPRAAYRDRFGSDPERVVDDGGDDFCARVAAAAGDGSAPLFPAVLEVVSDYPMVRGFDAADVVRAAQRRVAASGR